MHIIYKYANRKLYSKNESCYINLSDIGDLVAHGEKFQVIEKTSKKDITKEILQAVVSEVVLEKLSEEFLQTLIISTIDIDTEQEKVYTNNLN